jgi:type IV pilus assembly protein PilB
MQGGDKNSDKGVFFASGRKPLFSPSQNGEAPEDLDSAIQGQAPESGGLTPQQGRRPIVPDPAPHSAPPQVVRTIGGVPLDWPEDAPSPGSSSGPTPAQDQAPTPASTPAQSPAQASAPAPAWGVPRARQTPTAPPPQQGEWNPRSGAGWPSGAPASSAFDGSAARDIAERSVPPPQVEDAVQPHPRFVEAWPSISTSPESAPSPLEEAPLPSEEAAEDVAGSTEPIAAPELAEEPFQDMSAQPTVWVHPSWQPSIERAPAPECFERKEDIQAARFEPPTETSSLLPPPVVTPPPPIFVEPEPEPSAEPDHGRPTAEVHGEETSWPQSNQDSAPSTEVESSSPFLTPPVNASATPFVWPTPVGFFPLDPAPQDDDDLLDAPLTGTAGGPPPVPNPDVPPVPASFLGSITNPAESPESQASEWLTQAPPLSDALPADTSDSSWPPAWATSQDPPAVEPLGVAPSEVEPLEGDRPLPPINWAVADALAHPELAAPPKTSAPSETAFADPWAEPEDAQPAVQSPAPATEPLETVSAWSLPEAPADPSSPPSGFVNPWAEPEEAKAIDQETSWSLPEAPETLSGPPAPSSEPDQTEPDQSETEPPPKAAPFVFPPVSVGVPLATPGGPGISQAPTPPIHRVPIPDFTLGGLDTSPDGGRWVGPDLGEAFTMPGPETSGSPADVDAAFDATLEAFFLTNRSFRWKKVGELLKELGLISEADLKQALAQQQVKKGPLGQILVEMGLITDRLLLKVLAAQKDVIPWFFDKELESDLLNILQPDFCRRAQVLVVARNGENLILAMRNPADMDAIDHVTSVTGRKVEAALANDAELASKIEEAYSRDSRSHKAHVDALVQEAIKFADFKPVSIDDSKSLQTLEQETRPVTGIVNKIISDGIQMGASDIHIEPTARCLQVRYRMDGRLHKVSEIPKELNPMIAARVKIMAELDPVEWRVPQDGRIGIAIEGRPIDLRISVLPTFYGGRITMRILDRSVGLKTLDSIGFNSVNRGLFETLIRRPYGLFLVTGPTGSGKTTSLYAALNAVKDEETNIITCEDPVEYNIDGISQSQVNSKIGLTFAAQLRSILRQDPDVILVGEIRDHETAETAIRASITGHLVLSTLHCNDAPSAVPRMLDMGVDPYLLSTSIIGVMGQRLLRRICPDCRTEYRIGDDEKAILERTFDVTGVESLYKGHGCLNCGGTGFRGRFAVHEMMPVTHEVASAIATRENVEKLAGLSRLYGYRTMQEDAKDRVMQGMTTLREAQRLLAFEDIARVEPAE